jgi:hypothetical protein
MFTTNKSKSETRRLAPVGARRIAVPRTLGASTASEDNTTGGEKRKAVSVTPHSNKKVSCADPVLSTVAETLDMRLGMNYDSHKCVLKMVIKTKLFPLVKFITEGATDMQFSATKGICGFLIRHCNVAGNTRKWWETYHRTVRRIINDHRNNKIKCIQNAYYGELCNCKEIFVLCNH